MYNEVLRIVKMPRSIIFILFLLIIITGRPAEQPKHDVIVLIVLARNHIFVLARNHINRRLPENVKNLHAERLVSLVNRRSHLLLIQWAKH